MHAPSASLKPLSSIQLSADESKIVTWMKKAVWEPQEQGRDPIAYKAKVPEFFSGVRLYNVQGNAGTSGAHGLLSLFIKKLEYQGILSKQDLYPVATQGNARFLSLTKAELDNLGVGQQDDED